MLKNPQATKPKKPPKEIRDKESIYTFSSSFLSSDLFRTGEKKEHPPSSPKKENQKPTKKTTKLITTTDSIPSISFPPFSPKQYL